MWRKKPYSKLQQWNDSMQIIDEFIRIFTYKTHTSMPPLLQFEAPTSFLVWYHLSFWTFDRTLIPITQVSIFEYSLRETRPSLIDQWWHWSPLLWNQTTWLPPPLTAKSQEDVHKVKKMIGIFKMMSISIHGK